MQAEGLLRAEESTTESGEDSGVETSSIGDFRDRAGDTMMSSVEAEKAAMMREKEDGKSAGDVREVMATFSYRASSPAHRRVKESPLSSGAIFKQSHAGLLNLCIVVLIAVNSRLIIENLMKYGLLISAEFWFSSRSLRDWPLLMCGLTLPVIPLAAYVVEKLAWRRLISEPVRNSQMLLYF